MCDKSLFSQESNPKNISIGRSIPFYLGQEGVIITALIETLPLQLRRLNGRASASNGKRKSHRTSGPGLVHDHSFFLLFVRPTMLSFVNEGWTMRASSCTYLCEYDLITSTS